MGANISSQIVTSTTQITQNVLNSIVTKTENSSTVIAYSSQNAKIIARGSTLINCPLRINQSARIDALALGDFSNSLTNQVTNDLKAKLDEQIRQVTEQLNRGLNLGQANISYIRSQSEAYLNQNLKTVVEQQISNVVKTQGVADQNSEIDITGSLCRGSPIEISQGILMNLMARNIANNIVNNVIKNSVTADVAKKIDQATKQANIGLDFSMGIIIFIILVAVGFFFFAKAGKSFLKSPAGKIVMIVLVLGLLGLLGFVIYRRTRSDAEKVGIKK